MKPLPTRSGTGRPVVHASRFAEPVRKAAMSAGCRILDGEATPSHLAAVMDEASALILLDPRSFPFESLTGEQWDVPLVVALPPELGAGELVSAFGASLFERLGPFDRVVTADSGVWRDLKKRYRWTEKQWIEADTGEPVGLVRGLCSPTGEPGSRRGKAVFRRRDEALGRRLVAAREMTGGDPLEVLQVGLAGGLRVMGDPSSVRLSGVDVSEERVEAVRRDFPEWSLKTTGPDGRFPRESGSFDLVFGVDALQDEPPRVREAVTSEMWRVTRPGGWIVFIEDFVFERPAEREIPPMSVTEFASVAMEATANRVVLDHVESLRYPGEDMVRGAVVSLTRLGSR